MTPTSTVSTILSSVRDSQAKGQRIIKSSRYIQVISFRKIELVSVDEHGYTQADYERIACKLWGPDWDRCSFCRCNPCECDEYEPRPVDLTEEDLAEFRARNIERGTAPGFWY